MHAFTRRSAICASCASVDAAACSSPAVASAARFASRSAISASMPSRSSSIALISFLVSVSSSLVAITLFFMPPRAVFKSRACSAALDLLAVMFLSSRRRESTDAQPWSTRRVASASAVVKEVLLVLSASNCCWSVSRDSVSVASRRAAASMFDSAAASRSRAPSSCPCVAASVFSQRDSDARHNDRLSFASPWASSACRAFPTASFRPILTSISCAWCECALGGGEEASETRQ